MAQHNKRNLKYYLAELTILVLGISLSFVLNEYRIQQQEEKKEVELLQNFRDNLILDSLSLHIQMKVQDLRKESAESLLALTPESEFTDSIAYHIVILLNYGGFYPTDITYQEMRSLGNSRLIQNTQLLNEIIQLYEADYDLVGEWAGLDKAFMLNELLPYVHDNFPFAPKFQYSLMSERKKREMMGVLTTDKTKNLVQNSELTMLGSKAVFERAQGEVRRIVGMLNESLGDESELGKEASESLEAAFKAAEDSLKSKE